MITAEVCFVLLVTAAMLAHSYVRHWQHSQRNRPTVGTCGNCTDGGFGQVVIDELTHHHVQMCQNRIANVDVQVNVYTHQPGAGQRASITRDPRLRDSYTQQNGKSSSHGNPSQS